MINNNGDHPDAEPSFMDPDYEWLKRIRNCVRRDGKPLPWHEIRNMIKREKEVLKKWG
jgi:hypothetical protein